MKYLATSSDTSLESFHLSRMNRVANLRKELHDVVEEWIEAEVEARVAEWFFERGELERAGSIDVGPAAFRPISADQAVDAHAASAVRERHERCSRLCMSARAEAVERGTNARHEQDATARPLRGAGEVQMARKDDAPGDPDALEAPAVPRSHAMSRQRAGESSVSAAAKNVSRIDRRGRSCNVQQEVSRRARQDVPCDAAPNIPSVIPQNSSIRATCGVAKRRNVASRCLLRPQALCRCMAM